MIRLFTWPVRLILWLVMIACVIPMGVCSFIGHCALRVEKAMVMLELERDFVRFFGRVSGRD